MLKYITITIAALLAAPSISHARDGDEEVATEVENDVYNREAKRTLVDTTWAILSRGDYQDALDMALSLCSAFGAECSGGSLEPTQSTVGEETCQVGDEGGGSWECSRTCISDSDDEKGACVAFTAGCLKKNGTLDGSANTGLTCSY